MSVSFPPRRASCERCRAQKLRCVPSSSEGSNTTAPCQRCSRLQPATPCVFSSRSYTARRNKATRSMDGFDTAGLLPGMGTFVLAKSLPSPESLVSGSSRAPSSSRQLGSNDNLHSTGMELDDNAAGGNFPSGIDLAEFWNPSLRHQQDPDLFPSADTLAGSSQSDELTSTPELDGSIEGAASTAPTFDIGSHLEIYKFLLSQSENQVEMDPFLADDTPSPIIAFTSLLADMSKTETRLSKLPDSELENYPIGDVLYLCSRFRGIIADYPPKDSIGPSEQDPSALLLTVCCHMSLLRIYSSVFDYLLRNVSHPSAGERHSNHAHHHPSKTTSDNNTHAYRGLSFNQLQSHCLCATWDPAKKAASMLIGSFREVEEILQLPCDMRIAGAAAVAHRTGSSHGPRERPARSEGSEVGNFIFSKGGLMNGHLHTIVRTLVSGLGTKVKEVSWNVAFKDLLEM